MRAREEVQSSLETGHDAAMRDDLSLSDGEGVARNEDLVVQFEIFVARVFRRGS